jgi:hypothetical protein
MSLRALFAESEVLLSLNDIMSQELHSSSEEWDLTTAYGGEKAGECAEAKAKENAEEETARAADHRAPVHLLDERADHRDERSGALNTVNGITAAPARLWGAALCGYCKQQLAAESSVARCAHVCCATCWKACLRSKAERERARQSSSHVLPNVLCPCCGEHVFLNQLRRLYAA